MTAASSINTYIFRVEGMHCGSCGLLIDDALQDLPGVRDVHTGVKDMRTTVELDTSRNTPDDVITIIGEVGYHACQLE